MTELADHVFDACRRAASSWPRGAAEVLELLAWMTDNDSEVPSAIEAWLRSEDRGRVEVALEIEDWFPFEHHEEMAAVLASVTTRWPDLGEKCARLVQRRATVPEQSGGRMDAAARLERFRAFLKKGTD